MRKPKKDFSLSLFLKRVVVVTLILAVIELAFLYFYFNYNTKDNASTVSKDETTTEKPVEQPKTIEAASLPVSAIAPKEEKNITAEKPVDTIKKQVAQKPVEITERKITEPDSSKPVKVSPRKIELTEVQMNEVSTRLTAKQAQLNVEGKCVKIRQTSSSNVSNGFSIASFLKTKGYIISGRETVSKTVKGISVEASGNCMIVTVGTL